jgi:cation diffusion facilitator CzcD-associated flavoprotein CzcO
VSTIENSFARQANTVIASLFGLKTGVLGVVPGRDRRSWSFLVQIFSRAAQVEGLHCRFLFCGPNQAIHGRTSIFHRELSQTLTKFPASRKKEMMMSLVPTSFFID